MRATAFAALIAATLAASTAALAPNLRAVIGSKYQPVTLAARQSGSVPYKTYTFDQKIDHFPQNSRYVPHNKGSFKQRYFVDDTYYKPGGPVFLLVGGETNIEYWAPLLQEGIMQIFMSEFGGLGIILENRYYGPEAEGSSWPFNDSTTDHLTYMTTEQTIADFDYFARNVHLAGHLSGITYQTAPWFLYGVSLAGALTAFLMKEYPSTFFGGIASSGVIHTQVAYPQWYNPIQRIGAQDCIASVNDIVDKIDVLVASKNTKAMQQLKEIFGLGSLTDFRDFAAAINYPFGNPDSYPSNSYQEINWDPAVGSQDFFDFCRNVTIVNPPANNTAADDALAKYTSGQAWTNLGNYAAYIKRVFLPLCTSGDYNSPECFGTRHPEFWANTNNSIGRSFLYTVCTEFGAYQAAFPPGQPSVLSRVLGNSYTQQVCEWSFPPGKYNHIPATPNITFWNQYGDLKFSANRLAFVDGSADPWLDLCYHSELAPQRRWTLNQPEQLINGGGHGWDSFALSSRDAEPQFIRDVHYFEIRTIQRWLNEFKHY